MRQFLYLSVLAALHSIFGFADVSVQAAAHSEIITSRRQFSIPFRFDQQELKRLNAQKVHLFLSRDQGQSWRQIATAELSESQFIFQPDSDGEYWFSVAVSDAEQVMHPEPSLNPPGLKIVVDRTPAKMDLKVSLKPGRQLELSWKVSDAHPVVNSLDLSFRNSSEDPWNRVYVKKKLAGRTSWKIRTGQYPEIRGRFVDAAGNVTEKIVKLTAAKPEQNDKANQLARSDFSANGTRNQIPVMDETPSSIRLSSARQEHATQPILTLPGQVDANSIPSGNSQVSPTATGNSAAGSIERPPVENISSDRSAAQVSQPTYHNLETTRYMNSHQFEIDYQVAGVGPSGVSVVELFVTQDNGQQWWRYGVDADLKSPMTVQVPEDGRYGFHFRIHSGVGNAEPPPQPGQKPQIDLIVDSSKPHIQLLNSFQGRGERIDTVTVQWQYADNYPAEKPISIFYSVSRLGPWEQAEGALKNVGTHSFRIPRNAPSKLYLKIVARDAAGNLAEEISEKPLLIDRARPTARVITIEPVP